MNKKEQKVFLKSIKPIIKELERLERKHGNFKARYAMRRYIRQVSEEQTRQKEINRLQKEIEELKEKRI